MVQVFYSLTRLLHSFDDNSCPYHISIFPQSWRRGSMKEEYSYDKHGRLHLIRQANGAKTYYSYIPFGTKVSDEVDTVGLTYYLQLGSAMSKFWEP